MPDKMDNVVHKPSTPHLQKPSTKKMKP